MRLQDPAEGSCRRYGWPLICRTVEFARLNGRSEGAHHDPRRIRAQVQGLAIEKLGLGQSSPLESVTAATDRMQRRAVSIWVQTWRDPSRQRVRTAEFRRGQAGRTAPIRRRCSRSADPDEVHPSSCPYRSRSTLSSNRFRRGTRRRPAVPPLATRAPSSARAAARQAEIAASASTGCWSNALGSLAQIAEALVPTGLK